MTRFSMTARALAAAMLIGLLAPMATYAGSASPASGTPMNVNLAQNASFEDGPVGQTIPNWTRTGKAKVETFGTRPWPTQAYADKYDGGHKYLTCTKAAGHVSQTIDFDYGTHSTSVKVRLAVNFGGKIEHSIHISLQISNSDGSMTDFREKTMVLPITNSYKKAVTTLGVQPWTTKIRANIDLLPKPGAAKCRVNADSVVLTAFE